MGIEDEVLDSDTQKEVDSFWEKSLNDVGDAIDFIKKSAIFISDKYSWIKPLIDKLFSDALLPEDIDGFVSVLCEINLQKISNPELLLKEKAASYEQAPKIQQLQTIDLISNIRLLNLDKPIKFKSGLNIFYGKNGSGKSSIFHSLCFALGKIQDVPPNLRDTTKPYLCQISFLNGDGKAKKIEKHSGTSTIKYDVMIFDSEISNYIIEKDQPNEFELAHLHTEYFALLFDLYDAVEAKIKEKIASIDEMQGKHVDLIANGSTNYLPKLQSLGKEGYSKVTFSNEENEVEEVNSQLQVLHVDKDALILSNLENAKQRIKEIKILVGGIVREENKEIEFDFTAEKLSDLIDKVIKARNYTLVSMNRFSYVMAGLIKGEWVSNEKWNEFIIASLKFIETLEENDKERYESKDCLYCHQPLASDDAKSIIAKYKQIKDAENATMRLIGIEVDSFRRKYTDYAKLVSQLKDLHSIIGSSVGTICSLEVIDYNQIESAFLKVRTSIDEEKLSLSSEEQTTLDAFWSYYIALDKKFSDIIEMHKANKKTREEKKKELTSKLTALNEKLFLKNNKTLIDDWFSLAEKRNVLNGYLRDLTQFKRYCSGIKSRYSELGTLKTFTAYLKSEYEELGFNPPERVSISASTHKGICKRAYSMGDRQVSEIFSEGERKLHSLADFFANSVLTKYKGVFIFDDPVSSLDDDSMEVVSSRILNLLSDKNQVIVFTHNKFFLNCLVENIENAKYAEVRRFDSEISVNLEINDTQKEKLKNSFEVIKRKIELLQNKNTRDITQDELKNIYNKISVLLEDYIELKYLNNVVNRFRPRIRVSGLHGLKKIKIELIDVIVDLYNKTHRRAERHSSPEGMPELKLNDLLMDFKAIEEKLI